MDQQGNRNQFEGKYLNSFNLVVSCLAQMRLLCRALSDLKGNNNSLIIEVLSTHNIKKNDPYQGYYNP